jgi:hypothetical protein
MNLKSFSSLIAGLAFHWIINGQTIIPQNYFGANGWMVPR